MNKSNVGRLNLKQSPSFASQTATVPKLTPPIVYVAK